MDNPDRIDLSKLPDANLYQPVFLPWLSNQWMAKFGHIGQYTLVAPDRCYMLERLAHQALHLDGEFWECGVYRGGTAMLLSMVLSANPHTLRLFDTFAGMPSADAKLDAHFQGDFSDTSIESVRSRVDGPLVRYHQGLIPETFKGLQNSKIAFAHIDVDLYRSILDCCEFIYPRMQPSGFMIFDDYGFPSCPGARKAVDEFFADKKQIPLVIPTGQAIVYC